MSFGDFKIPDGPGPTVKLPLEKMKKWVDSFHAHLDKCKQCREHPFNLCPEGARLLTWQEKE